MKTITKKYKIYEFHELSEDAKQNALNKLQEINVDCYDWWEDDYLLDDALPKNIKKKIDKDLLHILEGKDCMFGWDNIYFDLHGGYYLQFNNLQVNKGFDDYFRQLLRIPNKLWKKVVYNFTQSHREVNTTIEFESDDNSYEFTDKENNVLDKAITIFDELIKNAWKNLNKHYYYLISEEAIIETIEVNDYEFLEDGSLF